MTFNWCFAKQLVTFNGIFDIIDQEDLKAEKAGAILRVNDVDSPFL